MKIKEGDVIEVLAISWIEPQWEFDFPSVILQPIIKYSCDGEECDTLIENLGINIMCGEDIESEDVKDEFDWRGWKLSTLKRVAKERLEGKPTWKTKIRQVLKQKLEFYLDKDGELDYKIIETVEA